ncbi:hypothetical protein NLU13_5674 [Sarocladium strictum]|uniref:Essential protein Yae1 N-terminal domain-containing protein n=1 Tax=Sarocladium strictum TaxID=5046 RepID=A0AA39L7F8_SARSR|nr:hypothetical protein NLU13_5674 [Sarocladium strictum]
MAAVDPLDDVFTIEDRFYTQGYNAGLADGAPAGRAEGRSLGMQKGFEKFSEASRLASRAVIWANRMPSSSSSSSQSESSSSSPTSASQCELPRLAGAGGPRLEKNVKSVYALLEPGTLSTKNEDEAVQDFDDRLRRAQGKVKIIERMLGTAGGSRGVLESPPAQSS